MDTNRMQIKVMTLEIIVTSEPFLADLTAKWLFSLEDENRFI